MIENFTTPEPVPTKESKKKWNLIHYLTVAVFIQSVFLFFVLPFLVIDRKDKELDLRLVAVEQSVKQLDEGITLFNANLKKLNEDIEFVHGSQMALMKRAVDMDAVSEEFKSSLEKVKEHNLLLEQEIFSAKENTRKFERSKKMSTSSLQDSLPKNTEKEMFKLKDETIIIKN